jgi:hypothetical protein
MRCVASRCYYPNIIQYRLQNKMTIGAYAGRYPPRIVRIWRFMQTYPRYVFNLYPEVCYCFMLFAIPGCIKAAYKCTKYGYQGGKIRDCVRIY